MAKSSIQNCRRFWRRDKLQVAVCRCTQDGDSWTLCLDGSCSGGKMVETVVWINVYGRRGGYFSSNSCYSVIVRSFFLPHFKRQSDVCVAVRQCLDVPSNVSWQLPLTPAMDAGPLHSEKTVPVLKLYCLTPKCQVIMQSSLRNFLF